MGEELNQEKRCYLPFWWQFLGQCYAFGIETPSGGIQGGTAQAPFPLNHAIWPAFNFDQKGRPEPRMLDYHPNTADNDVHWYLDCFGGWFLRDLSAESLVPEDKSKLFIVKGRPITDVFILESELEGDPAADAVLLEQAELFQRHLGWRPQ